MGFDSIYFHLLTADVRNRSRYIWADDNQTGIDTRLDTPIIRSSDQQIPGYRLGH